MTAYDSDGDGLPERDRPRVTGYDLDILSYWYFDGTRLDQQAEPPAMERAMARSARFSKSISSVGPIHSRGSGAVSLMPLRAPVFLVLLKSLLLVGAKCHLFLSQADIARRRMGADEA